MLERWGVVPLFTAVVLGMTWMAILFAITWRHAESALGAAEPAALGPNDRRRGTECAPAVV